MLKKNSVAILFSVFCIFLSLPAFITDDDDIIDKIASSLNNWTSDHPQEKVYLHTDKPYYALGDTIWFKAYLTIGSRHQLSAMSGAVYVDLVNEKDSIQQTLKLPVTAGMAMGDFTLADNLNEGNYRIRAYTQWMRNAGEDYYFDRMFSVGNAYGNEVVGKVDYRYKIIDNKPTVTAILNYSSEDGHPLAGKEVRYEIVANHQVIATEKTKTDTGGNISINMLNDQKSNLKGAYIQTTIQTEKKNKISKTFPIKAALSQSDVQFFPESGVLVNGLASRVAFKAVGVDGSGVNIKGNVTDNQNQEVASFESTHAGMGTFNLKPEAGKTYKAKIVYPDGSETTLNLPKAEEEGYVLAVYQTSKDSLLLRIYASAKQYQTPNQSISLIAQTGGETIYASPVKISKPVTSVWLQKKNFPTGIAQFTLFNNQGEPLNERIAFIRNSDQMQLKLSTKKTSYKIREKVEVELESKDPAGKPVAGNFSVSVIDESKVPVNESTESTILSNILLTSDLKGYIEKPNYYFTAETEALYKALDNLMLSQGYRRFTWKELLKETQAPPIYKAEKLSTEITGKVLSLTGKPVANGKVTLMSLKAGIMKDTTTDASGRFSFDKLVLSDSLKFTVQGRTQKNGDKVEVVLDKVAGQELTKNKNIADINTNIAGSTKVYLENSRKQDEALAKTGRLNRVQQLEIVTIKAKRPLVERVHNLNGPDRYDQIVKSDQLQTCPNLRICLEGKLIGVLFKTLYSKYGEEYTTAFSSRGDGPMLIVLDGYPIDPSDVGASFKIAGIFDQNDPPPSEVASIEVLRTPGNTAIYGIKGMNGVILVNTRRGGSGEPSYNPSIANISPKGFNNAREFYSPRYDRPKTNIQLPDLRSTIYWNPAIKTSTDGKTKFDFFNADDPGNYKVIIEGINAAGELGRQMYRYKVE